MPGYRPVFNVLWLSIPTHGAVPVDLASLLVERALAGSLGGVGEGSGLDGGGLLVAGVLGQGGLGGSNELGKGAVDLLGGSGETGNGSLDQAWREMVCQYSLALWRWW